MTRYRDWAISVLSWDGVLPFAVVAMTKTVAWMFPNNDAILVVFNVVIPIAAFFVRAAIADRQFKDGEQYGWQEFLFIVAIIYLVILDAFFILTLCSAPKPRIGWSDLYHIAVVYSFYFIAVSIALFPLRSGSASTEESPETEALE